MSSDGINFSGVASVAIKKGEIKQIPPATEKKEHVELFHGVAVKDPYQWLEDQESPKTREWIDSQNRYTRGFIDNLPVRRFLTESLEPLMKTDSYGIPAKRSNKYFFRRRFKDQQQFVICCREGSDGPVRILFDPNPLSPDHTLQAEILDVSENGSLMAVAFRKGGKDETSVGFIDVESGELLIDELPEDRYIGLSIMPDNSGFFYNYNGPASGGKVLFKRFGNPDPEIVFDINSSPEEIVFSELSPDGRYLLITVISGAGARITSVYLKEINSDSPVINLVNRLKSRFNCTFAGDDIIIHTDMNAPNGRVMKTPVKLPEMSHWQEIIPQKKAVINGMSVVGHKVIINYLNNVNSTLSIFSASGQYSYDADLPSIGTVGSVSGTWNDSEVFVSFTSYHIPHTIYSMNLENSALHLWHRPDVPISQDDYQIDQVWYLSEDNTKVPMFLLHRKGLKADGNIPVLLTGYGGFGLCRTPSFMPSAVLWADAGGILALPALRGGGEFGEEWHKAGMLENKQNVFDDFYAAAQWLIDNNYTNPGRIGIFGRSNGGLLVGAAVTQRPELFRAVVCSYPLLDMLKFHRFLVGMYWVSEYGSSDVKEQFEYIRKYSPYHNIEMGVEYPAVLFITGDSDTRVAPLHARKMTALMQEAASSKNPVLLLYDVKNGHVGGQPLKREISDLADELSFFFWQLSVEYNGENFHDR